MAKFQPGHKKLGGRKKGTPNKRTRELAEILAGKAFDPAEKLISIYREARKAYKQSDEKYAPSFLSIAGHAAKEIMQYRYPKRKAIDVNAKHELASKTEAELKAMARELLAEMGDTE